MENFLDRARIEEFPTETSRMNCKNEPNVKLKKIHQNSKNSKLGPPQGGPSYLIRADVRRE